MRSSPVPAAYGPPGRTRDRLVALIASGVKTATTSLLADYRAAGEPIMSSSMVVLQRFTVVGPPESTT